MFGELKFHFFLLTCLMAIFLQGCSGSFSQPVSWQDESVDLVWPEPPEQPRIRYLRSFTGPEDFQTKGKGSQVLGWLLGERQQEYPFVTPFSVASSSTGSVWIADSGARMLYRLDLSQKKIGYFQEFSGLSLESPSGVAFDNVHSRVYLSDAALKRIFVLDSEGNYLDSWGQQENLQRPAGLALTSDGRLLVADALGGTVYVYNVDGTLASQVRSKLSSDGRFRRPLNVAVGPQGEILVLDTLSFRVEVQDANGHLLGSIGGIGDAPGYLARPKGLAVDGQGHVFISDSAFDNIQVFDMTGRLLTYWGGAGATAGFFSLPAGMSVDLDSRLFVADSYNHRVQVFQLLP